MTEAVANFEVWAKQVPPLTLLSLGGLAAPINGFRVTDRACLLATSYRDFCDSGVRFEGEIELPIDLPDERVLFVAYAGGDLRTLMRWWQAAADFDALVFWRCMKGGKRPHVFRRGEVAR